MAVLRLVVAVFGVVWICYCCLLVVEGCSRWRALLPFGRYWLSSLLLLLVCVDSCRRLCVVVGCCLSVLLVLCIIDLVAVRFCSLLSVLYLVDVRGSLCVICCC